MIESLLLAVTRVCTFNGSQSLTCATGFFFEREQRLYLATNRHVVLDEATGHRPDRMEIEIHVDPANIALTTQFSIPLYSNEQALWKQVTDTGGIVDIVTLELDQAALPETRFLRAFSPQHLVRDLDEIEVGTRVVIVGFPLGFHDTFHHLPVARQAVIASAFGLRFQGNGYFLTDARMHRGTSGAPVVARVDKDRSGREGLPWVLLGIHAARMDVGDRDTQQDGRLDLNQAWYADALMGLTGVT